MKNDIYECANKRCLHIYRHDESVMVKSNRPGPKTIPSYDGTCPKCGCKTFYMAKPKVAELHRDRDALKQRVAELEADRDTLQRQAAAIRDAAMHHLDNCSACEGTGQDNDGECWTSAPCPQCIDLRNSLAHDAGREFVPRAYADKLAAELQWMKDACTLDDYRKATRSMLNQKICAGKELM